jgi:xanthine dehydrogenase accessory factor
LSDSLHETALDLQTEGKPYALVTVTDTVNSSPRKIGSKMLVRKDGSIEGSVGGGAMEAFVIEQAKQAIEDNESQKVSHRLEPNELNMYCGGTVEFFIDVERRSFHLLQFGAGHVGEAIARVGESIARSYTIVDDREEFADPEDIAPLAVYLVSDASSYVTGESVVIDGGYTVR